MLYEKGMQRPPVFQRKDLTQIEGQLTDLYMTYLDTQLTTNLYLSECMHDVGTYTK